MPGYLATLRRCILAATLVTAAVVCQPVPGGEKSSPTGKAIDELIAKLGDKRFAVREEAYSALVKIGKPALERLQQASQNAEALEIRQRALRAIREIDPGFFRRAELKTRRAEALKKVAAVKGWDARTWAEDVPNPFTNLTAEGKARLQTEGIDP